VSQPQQQMKMLEQIQKMRHDMQAAQEDLLDMRVEATAGGGVVKATVTGNGDLVGISIDPGVVDPTDVETLEDLVLAAVSEATRQARDVAQQKLGGVTSGLDLGGLGGGRGGGLGGLFG
jgi:nucleoid-associated protein EbfC